MLHVGPVSCILLGAALVCGGPPSVGSTPMTPADVDELRFYGCTALYGSIPVPYAEAVAAMPEGLVADRFNPGAPLNQFGKASALAQRCERVETDTGIVAAPYIELMHFIIVRAGPEYANPDGGIHALVFGFRTNHPELAATYEAWHLTPDGLADIDMTGTPPGSLAPTGLAVGSSDDYTSMVAGAMAPVSSPFAGVRFRVFGAENGVVVGAADYDIKPSPFWIGSVDTVFDPATNPFSQPGGSGQGTAYEWGPEELTQTFRRVPL